MAEIGEMVERCTAALLKAAGLISNPKIQDDPADRRAFQLKSYAETLRC